MLAAASAVDPTSLPNWQLRENVEEETPAAAK
jgi:hypothetical protein